MLGPYIGEGLRRGDRCAVICSPASVEGLRRWLAEAGLDVPTAEAENRLVVHHGEASAQEMAELFERMHYETEAAGDAFLRLAGDGGWALARDTSTTEMLRWETLYDLMSADWDILALCQFDLTSFGGDVVMDALRSHPLVVMGSVVLECPLHVAPQTLLEELAARA